MMFLFHSKLGKCKLASMRNLIFLILLFAARDLATAAPIDLNTFLPPAASTTNAPSPAEAAYEKGLELARDLKLEEAVLSLSQAIQADPSHAQAQHLMGLCYWLEGNPREAFAYLIRASRAPRAGPETFFALAAICKQRGGEAEAVGWYRKALERTPENERAKWREMEPFKKLEQSRLNQPWIPGVDDAPSAPKTDTIPDFTVPQVQLRP